jgi:dTDP-4-dehydrorhamnose reductase
LRRYLIIGASGFIGSHLFRRLGAERVVATYFSHPVPGAVQFDVTGSATLVEVLPSGGDGIAVAFLLQGIGTLDACARDPDGTARTNVAGVIRAIDELAAMNVRIVYCSSDAVFDGTRGAWTEESEPCPVLTYGKQKLAVERYLASKPVASVIARLSKVVGADPGEHSLFGEWIDKIRRGQPIRCAKDLIFTPIDVEDAVTALVGLADGGLSGVFNVCGPRSMSRLELLELFLGHVRRHRRVESEIVPCSIRDFPFLEPRPRDGSMLPDKLYTALGVQFDDMETVCRRIADEAFGAAPEHRFPRPENASLVG